MGQSHRACRQDEVLTGDCSRGFEGLRYLGVHVDHAVLLGSHHLIAVVVSLHDPIGEGLPDDGVSDVADELAWQPAPVLLLGQVFKHLGVLLDLLEYVFNREGLVHRHVDVADAVALDILSTRGAGLANTGVDVTVCPPKWP